MEQSTINRRIEEIVRRLRLLEERYSGLRKKTHFTEQNMLKDAKAITEEMDVLNETINELKGEMADLQEKMNKLSQEVASAVKKADFHVLAKYVEYWQPLDFLTREEALKLIREKQK